MSEHLRPEKMLPPVLIKELLRLARLDRNWLSIIPRDDETYETPVHQHTWLIRFMQEARRYKNQSATIDPSFLGLWATSLWLIDGPKVFRPTLKQQEVLAEVDLTLKVGQYQSPFPAILVETIVEPFYATLAFHRNNLIVLNLFSRNNTDDIVTTIYGEKKTIEDSIRKYDADCVELSDRAHRCGRIALNACLALTHFGHHKSLLFDHDVKRDRSLVKRGGKAAGPAGERLKSPWASTELLSFDQSIKLHDEGTTSREPGESTGREVSSHWRRGHWHHVRYGVGKAEKRLAYYKPTLVRADKFKGDLSKTTTTYRG